MRSGEPDAGAGGEPRGREGEESRPAGVPAPALRTHRELLLAYCAAHGEPPACPACQYSLRGITTDRCPECGTVLRLSLVAAKSARLSYTAAVVGLIATIVLGFIGVAAALSARSFAVAALMLVVTGGAVLASIFFDAWYWRHANASRTRAWRAVGVIWLVAIGVGAFGLLPVLAALL